MTRINVLIAILFVGCAPSNKEWESEIFAPVTSIVEQAIQDSVFPGGVLMVGKGSGNTFSKSFGNHDYSADAVPTMPENMFDLASLTKVLSTNLAIMKLYERGEIDIDETVAHYIHQFAQNGKSEVTIRNLLVHNSGFPSGRPFYKYCNTEDEVYDSLYVTPLRYELGQVYKYSDLSFITLGHLVEVLTGTPLEDYVHEHFYAPLGLEHTMFKPDTDLWPNIVPAEPEFNFRLTGAKGRAKNKITHLMNGVAGHAGLFSNAGDLAVLAQMLLNGGEYDGGRLLDEATVKLFTSKQSEQSTRGLGWDTGTGNGNPNIPIAKSFPPEAFGHTGFTGTLIWMDPNRDIFIIFLSNRTYDMTDRSKIGAFRPVLYEAILEIIDEASS